MRDVSLAVWGCNQNARVHIECISDPHLGCSGPVRVISGPCRVLIWLLESAMRIFGSASGPHLGWSDPSTPFGFTKLTRKRWYSFTYVLQFCKCSKLPRSGRPRGLWKWIKHLGWKLWQTSWKHCNWCEFWWYTAFLTSLELSRKTADSWIFFLRIAMTDKSILARYKDSFATGRIISHAVIALLSSLHVFSVFPSKVAGLALALGLWGILDLRHVFRSKKVLVFGVMEDIMMSI